MSLRSTFRSLLPNSNADSKTARRATIVVAGVLFFLASFTIVRFLLNFGQLQRLAEENNSRAMLSPGAVRFPPATETAGQALWLRPLNHYRVMVGLAPVSADMTLSRGDFLHSHYLTVNYAPRLPGLSLGAEVHTEDAAKPGFSTEGAAAASASDVDWSWGSHSPANPSWAIDNWMQAPFHRMQIINPYLKSVGYGSDCLGATCFAALNSGTDVDPQPSIASPWSKPIAFPPDGAVMDSDTFSGEWPDPLTACRGYAAPAGLPITLELGNLAEPRLSDYSVRRADADNPAIEACGFDASTYFNPDPVAQNAARATLKQFGGIVIVPRRPLSPGRYAVAIDAGRRYTWSFSIVDRTRG